MTFRVIVRARAESDIRAIYQWYEARQPGLGEEFLTELRRKSEEIRSFPESSPVLHRTVRRAILARFPYGVFYITGRSQVAILAVLHTSRDPAIWPKR